MNYNRYLRWCVVSSCTNNNIKTPKKLFINVPYNTEMRNVWLELANRDPKSLSTKNRLYLCEDHFNLEQDMENYMKYKINGSVKHVKMKVNTIPSRFCFHSEKKCRLFPSTSQSTLSNTQRLDFVQGAENGKLSGDYIQPTATSSKSGQTRDAIVQPGVSQCGKDLLVESETPQTNTNAPEHNMIEIIQISDERNSREEIAELYKGCYAIIANVYRYLKQEYEWLQRQLGSLYDVSALSDILARTAAAAGVSQRDVTRALLAHVRASSVCADHSYGARTSTTPSKPKNAGFSVRTHRKGETPSHTLKQKQEDHENHGKRARPSKKTAPKRSIRSKPSNEDQLLSKKEQSKGSMSGRKRQSNDNEEEHDGDSVGPPVRKSTRISHRSRPSNEEQLPFPSPIQLRVHGVMKTECKTEPADDDGQPTPEDDPLESGSWSHHHCEQAPTTEETETLFKTEPADDECLQDLKPDPLELESSAATLQEPPDSPDTPQIEVKFECVDEDMNVCEDYSVFDPMHLDTKSKPPE